MNWEKKVFFLIVLITAGCKEEFNPPVRPLETNYLVVEGFINAQGRTNILLSRTAQLKDTAVMKTEQGAEVTIMGDDNSAILLAENTPGHYQSDSVGLNNSKKYSIVIKTVEGKEYQSDYCLVKRTPVIDSVNWKNEDNGVNIYVNSHDEQTHSRYFKWSYDETWEVHSRWQVLFGYVNRNVSATSQDEINKMFYCWSSQKSSNILLGSTAQLTNNLISMIPIVNIPPHAEQLAFRYSILVNQVALDRETYEFYQIIKKNTEITGSLFGPLPTDLPTNIHCVSNPSEKVIGYMSVSTEERKRVFISNSEVPGWNYQSGCQSILVPNDESGSSAFANNGLIPYDIKIVGRTTIGFYAANEFCMDCRTRGTNVKPSFW